MIQSLLYPDTVTCTNQVMQSCTCLCHVSFYPSHYTYNTGISEQFCCLAYECLKTSTARAFVAPVECRPSLATHMASMVAARSTLDISLTSFYSPFGTLSAYDMYMLSYRLCHPLHIAVSLQPSIVHLHFPAGEHGIHLILE